MRIGKQYSYSALLCPTGIHAIAYRNTPRGYRIERYTKALREDLTAENAGEVLADLLEAEGARGRGVAIAVTGFGTCHQILTLPPANRELLEPIVARELRRFYPDLFAAEDAQPIIDFAEIGTTPGASGNPQKELMVAAVPRSLLRTVGTALEHRGIELEHWTILPRALQRLYDAFSNGAPAAAALIMVPDWPLLGLFHGDELRLFSEPRSGPQLSAHDEAENVVEQVERGALFLRQQFRGASVERLYLAAGASPESAPLTRLIEQRLDLPITVLGPADEAPGALAALGIALNADEADELNLLPPEDRPTSASERWTRLLASASAAIVVLAAWWWCFSAFRAESAASLRLQQAQEALAHPSSNYSAVRPVIDARQAHAQRLAVLELLNRDHRRIPEVLWPLQAAAPRIQVEELTISPAEGGWSVILAGISIAPTTGDATDAVEALREQLAIELPDSGVTLEDLQYRQLAEDPPVEGEPEVPYGPLPIAVSFRMSFIIGGQE